MHATSSIMKTASRLAALAGVLLGLLLLAGGGSVAAEGNEMPDNVVAFANAPGAVTITWSHSSDGVDWFIIEQQSPYTYVIADRDKRIWTITGLAPNTTYRYRVCAVFDTNRVCSDSNGVGYVSVTTMPPEPAGQRRTTPFIEKHYAGETWITVCFQSGGTIYDSYFVNRHVKDHPRTLVTVRDNVYGTQGCPRFENLVSGRTYVFGVQGCHEAYFGLGSDSCAEWSAGYEASTSGPTGMTVSFEAVNVPGQFIRHRDTLGFISRISSALDRADATWVVRPALSGTPGAVSFESTNYPGTYLRHQAFRIKQHRNDGSDLFKKDASFIPRMALTGTHDAVSYEAVNVPGHYIRHTNWELWLANRNGIHPEHFPSDASFYQRPPR